MFELSHMWISYRLPNHREMEGKHQSLSAHLIWGARPLSYIQNSPHVDCLTCWTVTCCTTNTPPLCLYVPCRHTSQLCFQSTVKNRGNLPVSVTPCTQLAWSFYRFSMSTNYSRPCDKICPFMIQWAPLHSSTIALFKFMNQRMQLNKYNTCIELHHFP